MKSNCPLPFPPKNLGFWFKYNLHRTTTEPPLTFFPDVYYPACIFIYLSNHVWREFCAHLTSFEEAPTSTFYQVLCTLVFLQFLAICDHVLISCSDFICDASTLLWYIPLFYFLYSGMLPCSIFWYVPLLYLLCPGMFHCSISFVLVCSNALFTLLWYVPLLYFLYSGMFHCSISFVLVCSNALFILLWYVPLLYFLYSGMFHCSICFALVCSI